MDIKVLLTGFKGTSTVLNLNEKDTINLLFEKVHELTGIEVAYLQISFKGKGINPQQDGHKTLASFGIKDKNSIQLVSRVHGGMLSSTLPHGLEKTKEPDIILYDDDHATWRYKMPCGHVMSQEGMENYCNEEVKHHQCEIKCPDCKQVWDTELVRHVAGMTEKEEFLFEEAIGNNYLSRGKPFKNCPQCRSACERINKKNPRVICKVCTKGGILYEFCWHCSGTWKTCNTVSCGNLDCTGEDPALTKLRQCPQTSLQGMNGKFPKIRACPECHSIIEHIGGCKQMDCKSCKTKFCFICLTKAKDERYQCGSYNTKCEKAPLQEYLFQ